MIINWSDIIGHKNQLRRIGKYIETSKLPHAIILAGPRGVGKHLIAETIGKILNCGNSQQKPCGQCRECREKTSMYIHRIEEIGSIKNEQIRDLQNKLSKSSFGGLHQIVIVDRVEKMTLTAANALLKILEEPQAKVIFVLITSDIGQVIKTIISRSSVIYFDRLSDGEIKEYIALHQENGMADKIKFFGGKINKWAKLKTVSAETLNKSAYNFWLLVNAEVKFKVSWVKKMAEQENESIISWMYFAETCLRDYILWKSGIDIEKRWYQTKALDDLYARMRISDERVVTMMDKTVWLRSRMKAGFNRKLQLIDWMI